MPETNTSAPCRVCGGGKGSNLSTPDANYFRCAACQTLQKQMSAEDYAAMKPGYDPGIYLANQSEETIRAHLDVEHATMRLRQLCTRFGVAPASSDFLDIGCGMGGNLLAAKDLGMAICGFEPSEEHGTVAKRDLGLPVVDDYFSSDKVGAQRFDIIMLSHVIEHIYDPKPFLEDVASVLKPSGLLVVVTPNANALIARLAGKAWPMLVPIDHVTMLSPRSITSVTPASCTAIVTTMEYPFEFFATLGSIVKARIKGRPTNAQGSSGPAIPKLMREASTRTRTIKQLLTVFSAPFYITAKATNRAAALYVVMQKSKSVSQN